MKILLDTCIWGGVRKELTDDKHDVIWAGEWDSDPGDAAIIERAYKEGRILITLDKDFGELAIVHNTPHRGIIRVVNFPVQKQGEICLKVLGLYGKELRAGSIVTVDPGRIRIRPSA